MGARARRLDDRDADARDRDRRRARHRRQAASRGDRDGRRDRAPDGRRRTAAVCGCGNLGCAEPYAQAGAMTATAGRDRSRRCSPERGAAIRAARPPSTRRSTALGIAIGNIVTVIVPDRVVIGGGISEAGDRVMTPLRAPVERRTPFVPRASRPRPVAWPSSARSRAPIGAASPGLDSRRRRSPRGRPA